MEKSRTGWLWVPTLFFTEGIPFVIVTIVSAIMYKRLGIPNSEIALYTSWFYVPWIIKPLWSPLIDTIGTKRNWIIITQFLIGITFASIAFIIPISDSFQFTLLIFWLVSFIAATHDIAADGFYMLGLKESHQSFFIGLRISFYKIALLIVSGLIILLAGQIESMMSISPAEFKVVANPKKFFEETIKVDSVKIKPQAGQLKIISNSSYLEISTKPKTRDQINFYSHFARSMNIMNGFTTELLPPQDTTGTNDLVGNIGIVKFYLSKQPSKDDEYLVKVDLVDGDEKFKVIEGKSLKFTSRNWNKPAFAVIQLDSSVTQKSTAVFNARIEKFPLGWSITFGIISALFFLLMIYHKIVLPDVAKDDSLLNKKSTSVGKEFYRSFARFFEKKKIIVIILFLLFYLFGRAQVIKIVPLFLLDSKNLGGLGLSSSELGLINIIISNFFFVIGSVLGGFLIYKKGLKHWTTTFLILSNLPLVVYIYFSWFQPSNFWVLTSCIAIDSIGYGLGFSFIMMYMIYVSEGEYRTSHFAIASGFMSLGLMFAGMLSGFIQQAIGYKFFFIWVVVSTFPAFVITKFIPLEYGFGKKKLSEV